MKGTHKQFEVPCTHETVSSVVARTTAHEDSAIVLGKRLLGEDLGGTTVFVDATCNKKTAISLQSSYELE